MWLHPSSNPTGEANDRRQSDRRRKTLVARIGSDHLGDVVQVGERMQRERPLADTHAAGIESQILHRTRCAAQREVTLQQPRSEAVPTTSSAESRRRCRLPLSFRILSACATDSRNRVTASLSSASRGINAPRHRDEKSLRCLMRSLVVRVTNR